VKKIINLLFSALLLLPINASKAIDGFSLIPAGPFTMGDSLDGLSDAPTRTVALDAYYMGKYEVTKKYWDEVRAWAVKNGYTDLAIGKGKTGNHPVHTISWYDAVKWCNARSQKEGLVPVYYTNNAQTSVYKNGSVNITNSQVKWSANGYRLPTEAEWEKAARGGLNGMRFPWGNLISHSRANFNNLEFESYQFGRRNYHSEYSVGSKPYTAPVGSFAPNNYKLYDMAGNVWEMCWDLYGNYPSGNLKNPRGASSGAFRIFRGGSWDDEASCMRIALRGDDGAPEYKDAWTGFRLVRSMVVESDRITSSLSKVVIAKGKPISPYTILNNFGAKNFSATNLPPGLRLGTNGVISGTPKKVGIYKATITARKTQGGKVVKSAKATKILEVK
jgi:formylglycine-generating enzyme required for sulfatase activity